MLCELLAQLYARISAVTTKTAEGCDSAAYVDAYLKLDGRIKVPITLSSMACSFNPTSLTSTFPPPHPLS